MENDKRIAVLIDADNVSEKYIKHIFDEMMHFFKVYKELENKTTAVDEMENSESAVEIIHHDIESYVEKFCK